MSAGGNNADLGQVITNCVYQPDLRTTYDCTGALNAASTYIKGDVNVVDTLRSNILATYNNILNKRNTIRFTCTT